MERACGGADCVCGGQRGGRHGCVYGAEGALVCVDGVFAQVFVLCCVESGAACRGECGGGWGGLLVGEFGGGGRLGIIERFDVRNITAGEIERQAL